MPNPRIRSYYPSVGGGGGSTITLPAFTDSFGLKINFVDSNAVPTDAASFVIRENLTDSNAVPTEALTLNIKGLGDTNSTPTDSQSFIMRVWLSGSSGTSNVTNPANANGQNDGAVATCTTTIGGSATSTLTSNLGSNVGTISFTTVKYRGWFKAVNTLPTSFGQVIAHSSSALFSDIVMFNGNAINTTYDHLSGDFTFDLIAAGVNTLAKIQSLQIFHFTNDAAGGVSPHVLTVDAGALDIAGVF